MNQQASTLSLSARTVPSPCTAADQPASEFARDLLAGLAQQPRSVSPKYFYDAEGSALFDRICRVGRSLRVHLLLATQSLNTGGVRIDKLEPNLTYRIALRTTSSAESKAVIGTPEAQYITNKESGVGFLRVGMDDPVKFRSVYTGTNYVPASSITADGEVVAPRTPVPSRVRIQPFTAAPMMDASGVTSR